MPRLLVVDDNEQNRSLLQTLLLRHGYEVVLAADGAEALAKARDHTPDLIITDILMPRMDGYALCRQWKRDAKLNAIPFVFYTATYTDPKDEQLALGMGAERFIRKPQELGGFLNMIEEVIKEHKAGRLAPPREPVLEETVYLKEYNEVLIRKLEDKLVELESAKTRLEGKEEELRSLNKDLELRVEERTSALARANRQLLAEIDERKGAEQTIVEQQIAMTNAARLSALGLMASRIAHEINNPLASVSMAAENMERLLTSPEIDLERAHSVCETIGRNVKRASGIIQALRNLSCESDVEPLKETSAADIVNGVLDLCREHFSVRGIHLIVPEIPENISISCRAPQLLQVVLNLLNNAYDAVENLAEKWIRVEVHDSGDSVTFSFTDSGHGLTADARDNLFVPFFTTKPTGKGAGLGLSISKKLVEDHGGRITVDPECPNTRVVICLPKGRAASPPTP